MNGVVGFLWKGSNSSIFIGNKKHLLWSKGKFPLLHACICVSLSIFSCDPNSPKCIFLCFEFHCFPMFFFPIYVFSIPLFQTWPKRETWTYIIVVYVVCLRCFWVLNRLVFEREPFLCWCCVSLLYQTKWGKNSAYVLKRLNTYQVEFKSSHIATAMEVKPTEKWPLCSPNLYY